MLEGLIFDFDGLILDTETPEYTSWVEVYQQYGCDFPIELWGKIVGGDGAHKFDPLDHLESLTGLSLDKDKIGVERSMRDRAKISKQEVLPGVILLLEEAKNKNMKLAVASSSTHLWVDDHLKRLNLYHYFNAVICADDVHKTKPDPALYYKALDILGLVPSQVVVFEDSPNGLLASKHAGIFCVVVPNPVTEKLNFNGADLILKSLSDINIRLLNDIIRNH